MPRWLDSVVDKYLQNRGYVKDTGGTVPMFAGETRHSPAVNFGDFSDEQMEKLAATSAWVWSDIQTLANEASQAPLGIHRIVGERTEEVASHPFELIWRRPNDRMSGAYLRRYTLWWWLLRGEAYLFKKFDNAGGLVNLLPVPASRMAPIPHPTEYISGFRYLPLQGRKPITLLPGQVVFFRFPNPFDYHRGMSPISAYKLAVQTDIAAAKWNLDTFNNGATLQMLLSLPKDLSPTEYERRKADLLDQMLEKQRRFLVMRAGDIDTERLGMTHEDAEFLAGREFSREEIDRVYGFPAGYWAKDANRANADAAKASLIEGAVWPLLVLMAEEMTVQVIIPEYGEEFVALYEDIRPRDRRLLVTERRQYWQVKTIREARSDLGLDPLGTPVDDMLFPHATRVALGGGVSPIMSLPGREGLPSPSSADEVVEKAMRDDLKRWRSIALRRMRDGEEPDGYDFESDAIPPATKAEIEMLLSWANSEEEVKAAFAAPFRPAERGGEGAKGGYHRDHYWPGYP